MKKLFLISLTLVVNISMVFSQTPSSPISYNGQSNIVIDGKSFTSGTNGASIYLTNCTNVKITNCSFSLNENIVGIQMQNCTNVEVTGCYFENFFGGVYCVTCKGGIDIHCNSFKNIAGKAPRGQAVQFNKCYGTGNRVNYNIIDHEFGTGHPEDLFNMYGSYGTTADPIQIIGNQLRGGGPSTSGGGIMVGDDGGHDMRIEDNILVDIGQYGIGCPAGYNMTIINNKVYASSQPWTNVGIYVGLQGEINAGFPCEGTKITVKNNQVNFTNKNGVSNGWYNCPCCPGVIQSGNNFKANINASILPTTLMLNSAQCPVTPPESTTQITSLSLINAENESVISGYSNLSAISTIKRNTLTATKFNVYANVSGTVDSVLFSYNLKGTAGSRKEGVVPYALRGDGTGYTVWNMDSGSYSITAKSYEGGTLRSIKSANFKVVIDQVTGFAELPVKEQFSYYPNPASSQLRVSDFEPTTGLICISNLLGQPLIMLPLKSQEAEILIDVSQLQNGIYTIRLGNAVKMFVKQ